MPHHVYANDNEICSKSADGTSQMASDVCFSPGAPMPGVPILYMNMCKASDVTNGSKTVFIKRKEICLQNKSYFKTSYGDEPATPAMKKGTISGAIQGKCYFISWSPNVFAEGLSVTRHMDLVTHNHSNPANTPPVYYISIASGGGKDCRKDVKEMERHCKPNDPKKRNRKKGVPKGKQGGNHGGWVLDHCGPLMFKPGADFDEWYKEFGDFDKVLDEATKVLRTEVIDKLQQEIIEFGTKKALAFAARRGLTGWIPFVGWAITAVDAVATGIEVYQKLPEMKQQLADLKDIGKRFDEAIGKMRDSLGKYQDKLKNWDKLSDKERKAAQNELMADLQSAYAAAEPCTRARKCLLVPFNKTTAANNWAGNGCCPGQTGHHLLPDAMFRDPVKVAKFRKEWNANPANKNAQGKTKAIPRDKLPTLDCWKAYKEGKAPTICMEGADNTSGSHGAFHRYTAAKMERYRSRSTMDYKTARDLMVKEVAVLYGCEVKCLKAQLDAYYEKIHNCGPLSGAKVTPHSGMKGGGPK